MAYEIEATYHGTIAKGSSLSDYTSKSTVKKRFPSNESASNIVFYAKLLSDADKDADWSFSGAVEVKLPVSEFVYT